VNVFVMVEVFYLFNCRSLERSMFRIGVSSNPWVIVGVLTMITLQLLLTYLPIMNGLFHTAPMDAVVWVPIVLIADLVYAIAGTEKWMWRHFSARPK
jgi:cation-transporting P-type ATPase F